MNVQISLYPWNQRNSNAYAYVFGVKQCYWTIVRILSYVRVSGISISTSGYKPPCLIYHSPWLKHNKYWCWNFVVIMYSGGLQLCIPPLFTLQNRTAIVRQVMERCGVVGSTLAFRSIGSNPSTAYFHIMIHQPSASWDHWRSAHWTIQFVDSCSSLS